MKILSLFADTSCEQVQELLERGLLADLRDGNFERVDRDEFRRVLGLAPLEGIPRFPTWKTVTRGTYKSASAYRKALKKAGINVSRESTSGILDSPGFTVSETEVGVDIVLVSSADFGFEGGAYYSAICARAQRFGLKLCPAELGPALRLACTEELRGRWVIVAMEAIADSEGTPRVFDLVHTYQGPWFGSTRIQPDPFQRDSVNYVFVQAGA